MTAVKKLREKWPEGFILQATFLTPEGSTFSVETGLPVEAAQKMINMILAEQAKGNLPTAKPGKEKGKG